MIKKTHTYIQLQLKVDTAQMSLTVVIRPHSLLKLSGGEDMVVERDKAGIMG